MVAVHRELVWRLFGLSADRSPAQGCRSPKMPMSRPGPGDGMAITAATRFERPLESD